MSTYQFKLSEQFRALAQQELQEDDDARQQSIAQLRQWIEKNPHIKKCRTDDRFLLKFLRYRKFRVHSAGEAIVRYLVARQKLSEWFRNPDPHDPALVEILDDCAVVVLGRDDVGRTVLLVRFGRFNVEKVTQQLLMRLMMMFLEVLIDEEEVQVGGLRVWLDFSNMSKKFVRLFNMSEMNSMMDLMTKTMPLRIREVHAVQLPKFATPAADFAQSFVSPKLKQRITCHATQLEAKKHMPEALWPEEYDGSVDSDELNRRFRGKIEQMRYALLTLDDKLEIDVSHYAAIFNKNVVNMLGEIESGTVGSFRRLSVD